MDAMAVILREPEMLAVERLDITTPGDADVVVDIQYSGISTGTERLLWSGRMPPFPGMGYPLVPGYESVGRVVPTRAPRSGHLVGEQVFVPGANCFGPVRGLFGGAASRLVVPGARVLPIARRSRRTRRAAGARPRPPITRIVAAPPELIIGHGVLGRLTARMVMAVTGAAPVVWECNPARADGGIGYSVCDPADDPRRDYRSICDVSGDATILDSLIARLAPGGEIVLAGFYSEPLSFAFPAGLHAGGADAGRGAMAEIRPRCRQPT